MTKITIENTSSLGRKLTFTVPQNEVTNMVHDKLNTIAKTVKINGFSRGRSIPRSVLEQKFKARAEEEASIQIVENNLKQAYLDYQIKPVAQPAIESISREKGQDHIYVVSLEVYPSITLKPLDELKVDAIELAPTSAELEAKTTELQEKYADWQIVERAAKSGDRVLIDYESTLMGKAYEHSTGDDVNVDIGTGNFIKGLEDGLIGAQAGDNIELDLSFPKDWNLKPLAGKDVHFAIKVKAVKKKILAALDENLAAKISSQDASPKAIKARIKEMVEEEYRSRAQAFQREQALNNFLSLNPFDLPESLVQKEFTNIMQEQNQDKSASESIASSKEELMNTASKRVAIGLLLGQLLQQEKITLDKSRVEARIKQLSTAFGNNEFIERMYHRSEELLASIHNAVLMDQAAECLIAKAQKTSKKLSIKQFESELSA